MLEETTLQKSPRLFSCSQLSPRKAGVSPGQRTSAAPKNLSRPRIGFHLLLKIQLPFECSICNPQVGEREYLQDPAGGFRRQAWPTSYALAWTLLSFHRLSDCNGKLLMVSRKKLKHVCLLCVQLWGFSPNFRATEILSYILSTKFSVLFPNTKRIANTVLRSSFSFSFLAFLILRRWLPSCDVQFLQMGKRVWVQ